MRRTRLIAALAWRRFTALLLAAPTASAGTLQLTLLTPFEFVLPTDYVLNGQIDTD